MDWLGNIVFKDREIENERLELTAQSQLMVTYVVVDGRGQAVGFSGGWAGVGYRF